MLRRRERRGNYSLLMGLSIVGIVGMGALAVDLSYLAMASLQAQAVSDAAAQAAILTYRASEATTHSARVSEARTAADWIVAQNRVGVDGPGTVESFVFGTYDHDSATFRSGGPLPNAVEVRVGRTDNPLQTFLAGVIGVDEMTVSRQSVAAFQPRHVMMVVDHSASMWQGQGVPYFSDTDAYEEVDGVRYATAHAGVRDALTAFAGYAIERRVTGDAMGASVFAENSDLWKPLVELDVYGGDLYSAFETWGPPNAIRGGRAFSGDQYAAAYYDGRYWRYGTNGNRARGLAYGNNGVDDCRDVMEVTFRWEGWNRYPERPDVCDLGTCTNPAPAIRLAVDELANSGDTAFKAILLVSDGMPTCGEGESGLLSATRGAWEQHGIHVWTVAYDGSDGIDSGLMESAAQGMGTYSETPSADQLDDILLDIARSFPIATVE